MLLLQILAGAAVLLLFSIFLQLQADSSQITGVRHQLEKLGAPISLPEELALRPKGGRVVIALFVWLAIVVVITWIWG